MISSIERFRKLLDSYKVAKSNEFKVRINVPQQLLDRGKNVADSFFDDQSVFNSAEWPGLLTYYCESVDIPSRNISSASVRLEHAYFEMPYGVSYEPITINFYLDEKLYLRSMFKKWYDLIYDRNTNGIGFHNDYAREIEIMKISKSTNLTNDAFENNQEYFYMRYRLERAFPKTIGQVRMSSSDDSILILPVTFSYESIEEIRNTKEIVEVRK